MNSYRFCAITVLALAILAGCSGHQKKEKASPDSAHNSRNSLDWWGRYGGEVRIKNDKIYQVELTLNSDKTYILHYQRPDADSINTDRGAFKWDDAGGSIELIQGNSPFKTAIFKVGEQTLILQSENGKGRLVK